MSDFDINFKFLMDGKLKFENNSNLEYDIMVHYTNEENDSKTLYLWPEGRKYAREIVKSICFEGEFVYKNEFTGISYKVPEFCVTIYPKENRKYSKESKENQKIWNDTTIKNLNDEFRSKMKPSIYQEYEEYYYNLNFKEKNKNIQQNVSKPNIGTWENKLILKQEENKISNIEYKGLSKLEKTKKLLDEITKLDILRKKLNLANIKFDFSFESEYYNYDSKNE